MEIGFNTRAEISRHVDKSYWIHKENIASLRDTLQNASKSRDQA